MTTYAVTPTLFVGVEPPDGVSPVLDLSGMDDTNKLVEFAVKCLHYTDWEGGSNRPAVVVPTEDVARRVLLRIGMTEAQVEDRIKFATKSFRAA